MASSALSVHRYWIQLAADCAELLSFISSTVPQSPNPPKKTVLVLNYFSQGVSFTNCGTKVIHLEYFTVIDLKFWRVVPKQFNNSDNAYVMLWNWVSRMAISATCRESHPLDLRGVSGQTCRQGTRAVPVVVEPADLLAQHGLEA